MLLLELEGDFQRNIFPALDLPTFMKNLEKYKDKISKKKIKFYKGNLDLLIEGLNRLLTGMDPRDIISFYLLVSYLRKNRAGNKNLKTEIGFFGEELMKNLYSFSLYDEVLPKDCKLSKTLFKKYMGYKNLGRQATSEASIRGRLEFILEEFKRICKFKQKDPKRFHDVEEKRILFFRQKGICPECKKEILFGKNISSDHIKLYSKGGKTSDLSKAQLLHERCHRKLEKRRLKIAKKPKK